MSPKILAHCCPRLPLVATVQDDLMSVQALTSFLLPLFLQGENSSSPVSMVMPVSVPVQSRGTAKACRGGQRRSSRLSPATGGTVLYRSLLHQDEEETVAKGDGAVSCGGDEEVVVEDGKAPVSGDGGSGVHYTPPPMLCPIRVGQGLYCSLTSRRQQRVQTVQLHNTHSKSICLQNKSYSPASDA